MTTITVVLPTYNPVLNRLEQTLNGLKQQTLSLDKWQLLLIDNNSSTELRKVIDLSWHPNAEIISERQQGLTAARIAGFTAANHDIIVMVDDDNILHPSYLSRAVEILDQDSTLGAIGGKSIPIFEGIEPNYLKEFYHCLALRDLGDKELIAQWNSKYPDYAPIGAGMVLRKTALKSYIEKIEAGLNIISDRKGSSLSSGGDNDIVLEILKSGFSIGYFPQLCLQHIIPEERTSIKYLSRLNFESSSSWVRVLDHHGILPWKKIGKRTLFLRYLKTYLISGAWQNNVNYAKWKGSCGLLKGLSEL